MRWWLLRLINGKIFIILRLTVNYFLLFWLFWLCHDKLISPLRLWYSYDLPPPNPSLAVNFLYSPLYTLLETIDPLCSHWHPCDLPRILCPPLRWRLASKGYREKIEVYSGDTRLRQELLITTTRHNKPLIQLCRHRSLKIFFNQFFSPLIRLMDMFR